MRGSFKTILVGVAIAVSGSIYDARQVAQAAEPYPTRTISLICALPPGSGADVLVRYFGDKLAEVSHATVIVENKPGAAGNIAAEYVVRAKPDGYTVYVHGANTIAANLNILKSPPFRPDDLQVVANIHKQAFMIAVPAQSPAKSLPELTELLKQKGDKGSYAVSAVFGRIVGELYKQTVGVNPILVNYRSAPQSLNDMMSGAVDFGVFDPVFAFSQAREGRFRILAISSGERMATSPDVPTMIEGGVAGMDMRSWFSAMVPAATPRPIVDQLNVWFNQILSSENAREFLALNGGEPFIVSPDEGQALFKKAVVDYKDYVKRANVPQE
jgi:tripartite-type tricarboxylate transporter receptor subunit TctC